jgi:hypothetical protein
VKVFNAIIRVNGETFEVTSLIHLVIHWKRWHHINVVITC